MQLTIAPKPIASYGILMAPTKWSAPSFARHSCLSGTKTDTWVLAALWPAQGVYMWYQLVPWSVARVWHHWACALLRTLSLETESFSLGLLINRPVVLDWGGKWCCKLQYMACMCVSYQSIKIYERLSRSGLVLGCFSSEHRIVYTYTVCSISGLIKWRFLLWGSFPRTTNHIFWKGVYQSMLQCERVVWFNYITWITGHCIGPVCLCAWACAGPYLYA